MARIERKLAQIGLVANSSKTALWSKVEFRNIHHESDNEFLDKIHEMTASNAPPLTSSRVEFEKRLRKFLNSKPYGQWSRILRRYYTESKRIRSKTLLDYWDKHLRDYPTVARHIFDYISFFPGFLHTCQRLFNYLEQYGSMHEDLQILSYETLLLVPFPNDPVLRSFVAHKTYAHYYGRPPFQRPSGYVRGLQSLVIFKFGTERATGSLARDFAAQVPESPTFATYAYPVITTNRVHSAVARACLEHIEDPRIVRLRTLLSRLESGDLKACKMFWGALEPKITKFPARAIVNARNLPLLEIIRNSPLWHGSSNIPSAVANTKKKVENVGEFQLVDWITVSHLL